MYIFPLCGLKNKPGEGAMGVFILGPVSMVANSYNNGNCMSWPLSLILQQTTHIRVVSYGTVLIFIPIKNMFLYSAVE